MFLDQKWVLNALLGTCVTGLELPAAGCDTCAGSVPGGLHPAQQWHVLCGNPPLQMGALSPRQMVCLEGRSSRRATSAKVRWWVTGWEPCQGQGWREDGHLVEVDSGLKQMLDITSETLTNCESVIQRWTQKQLCPRVRWQSVIPKNQTAAHPMRNLGVNVRQTAKPWRHCWRALCLQATTRPSAVSSQKTLQGCPVWHQAQLRGLEISRQIDRKAVSPIPKKKGLRCGPSRGDKGRAACPH